MESYIIKACLTFVESSKLSWLADTLMTYQHATWASKKRKNLLSGNTIRKPSTITSRSMLEFVMFA